MEEQGGYDLTFVSEVNDHLICVICQLVLRNPVSFIDCGHRLCRSCYEEIKEDAENRNVDILCPHDRSKVDTTKVFEDKGTTRMIGDLKVKCKYVTKGCDWMGELSNLKDHLSRYCVIEEKEKPDQLLQTILKKLDQYEKRLNKNEEEVNKLRGENRRKDDEIMNIKEKLVKNEEVNKLRGEIRQQGDKIKNINKKLALKEKELKNFGERISSMETKTSSETYKCNEPSYQLQELQKKVTNNENIINADNKKINTLEIDMDMIKLVEANKKVVYKWRLEDYNGSKAIGEVYSPTFYAKMAGHCCEIGLRWLGKNKGKLALYLHTCRRADGFFLRKSFSYDIIIVTHGKDEDTKETASFTSEEFLKNKSSFFIHGTNERSEGYGLPDFLNMPHLQNFIHDNSMLFTITILPK